MANSARKNRHQKIDKRLGHKQARQATRRVLENGAKPSTVHGVHWSPSIEQPPLPDEVVIGGPKAKKKGCKRNKGGPHVIVPTPVQPSARYVPNGRGGFDRIEIPWYHRRYMHPFRCKNCTKQFWRMPKQGAITDSTVSTPAEPTTPTEDHWDMFNIKMRLLGLKCHCTKCQAKEK